MEKPKRRTLTRPGLGDSGLRPKHAVPAVPATIPPTSGVRETEDTEEVRAEKISGRRPRTSRPPVRVDDVGAAAVALASKQARLGRNSIAASPKLLKTRRELERAPINHRDAFVLSLIDGKTSLQGVIDLAAMPDGEVLAILQRLAGLGIVSLP
jgi:hypothetical protein